jgi:hypothetical protein
MVTNCQQTYEPILLKGKLSTYLMRVETRERERDTHTHTLKIYKSLVGYSHNHELHTLGKNVP